MVRPACTPWFGQIVEPHFAVQGNMLIGAATIEAMAEAFRRSASLDLAERLLLALEAGEAAGGDKRGRQSAALKVHHVEDYPWLDLRVDEHRVPGGRAATGLHDRAAAAHCHSWKACRSATDRARPRPTVW